MTVVTKAKNKDYTGGTADAFSNFTRVELMGITTTEIGFLTRMSDKLARITSFVHTGELHVKDEAVEDTLIDLANYSALLWAYLKSRERRNG